MLHIKQIIIELVLNYLFQTIHIISVALTLFLGVEYEVEKMVKGKHEILQLSGAHVTNGTYFISTNNPLAKFKLLHIRKEIKIKHFKRIFLKKECYYFAGNLKPPARTLFLLPNYLSIYWSIKRVNKIEL